MVKSCLNSTHIEDEITSLKKAITKTQKDIKEIININVDSISNNSDFYKSIYDEKKAELIDLKAKLSNKKSLLLSKHLHEERIQEMKSFLDGHIGLNKNILLNAYKFIIALNPSEALLLINDEVITKKRIDEDLDIYKAISPIFTGYAKSPNGKQEIHYKVIDLRKTK